jgi:sugar phosphate isomerase/epimerase
LEDCAVKLVHSRTDAPRQLPEEMRRVVEKLGEIFADIAATENPFSPPPDRPPPGAPGQRPAHHYDELAEEAEAAEQQVA